MTTPRAYTPEELREMVLYHMRTLARYWANLPDQTPLERCEGVAFSILTMIDGSAGGVTFALTLVADCDPGDKQFRIDEGENWVEPGTDLNSDCMLHEVFYQAEREQRG